MLKKKYLALCKEYQEQYGNGLITLWELKSKHYMLSLYYANGTLMERYN